jgi:tetratricopeptide (TPR) repeat protein
MMKRILRTFGSLILFLAFVLPACLDLSFAQKAATAVAPGALFYQANINYQEGNFEAAIEDYNRLIDMGWEGGSIYYNLGNSYFKDGRLGLAVLSYDKAMSFIPNDSDLKSNYDYVLQRLKLEPRPFGSWIERTVHVLFQGMTIDILTVFLSVLYTVLIALLILSLFFPRLKRYTGLAAFVFLALFVLSAYALRIKINYLHKFAVVTAVKADARFEPLDNATVYFSLPEGSKVEVVEKAGDWCKIRRFDNKLAWVKQDVLAN